MKTRLGSILGGGQTVHRGKRMIEIRPPSLCVGIKFFIGIHFLFLFKRCSLPEFCIMIEIIPIFM